MVLFFSATLLVSIGGLISLIWIKRWELQTGNMLFADARPAVGKGARSALVWVERVLPGLVVSYIRRAGLITERLLHRGAAELLLSIEHGLEHVLHSLRGVTEKPRPDRPASVFLQEVAEHKRKLLHRKKARELKE